MPKITGECAECGKAITYWPSQVRKFCSLSCRSIAEARRTMPKKPRTGRYDPCEICGTSVWRRQHQIRDGLGRYCSKECRDKAQRKGRTEFACETCGRTFALKPSQVTSQTGRFCSRACESESRLKRRLDRTHNGRPAVLDAAGYVRIYEPTHPRAMNGGWMFEHRWIVEQALGRVLMPDEHVHHLNGVKNDNRLENLELLSHGEHSRITGKENGRRLAAYSELAAELDEYRRRYGPLT